MDIRVFNDALTFMGVVDNYDSVDFKTRFSTVGDFIITAPITDHNLKRLSKGNFILVGESAGYIETVQLDEDFTESKLTAVGYDLKGLLANRINWGMLNYSGTVENLFRKLVNDNCISTITERVFPFLELGQLHNFPETVEIQDEGTQITELLAKHTELYKIGWDIRLNPKEKKLIFNTFKGVDRTINQSSVPPLVFESERENILGKVYVNTNEGHKNVAYIMGAKVEGTQTPSAVIGDSTGFQRREMFIQSTAQKKDASGVDIPEADYLNLIKSEGERALAEKPVINNFDCVVNTRSLTSLAIGDFCTVKESKWGLLVHSYISEIERIYDQSGETLNVVFGNNIPSKKKGEI